PLLDDQDPVPLLREAQGRHAAAEAGADHDPIVAIAVALHARTLRQLRAAEVRDEAAWRAIRNFWPDLSQLEDITRALALALTPALPRPRSPAGTPRAICPSSAGTPARNSTRSNT